VQKLLNTLKDKFPEIEMIEEKREFIYSSWILDFKNGNSMIIMKQPPPYIGDGELYTIATYNSEEEYDDSLTYQGEEAYLTDKCIIKSVDFIRSL
jgi:hypothetical protein